MGENDSFVHLHTHTEYSMLDGAAKLDELFKATAGMGMPAIAMTDHGNIYGAFDFYTKAAQHGVKPIIGSELYLSPESRFDKGKKGEEKLEKYSHMTVLATSPTGYANLVKLSSLASLTGFYQKPRVDRELLSEYSKDIIATTGCLGGEVQQAILKGRYDEAKRIASEFKDIFGADNFFVEIMEHGVADEKKTFAGLIQLSRDLSIPLVATNDLHYTKAEDAIAHEVLLCVQTGATLADPKRFKFEGSGYYLKSPAEMRALFRDYPEACDNTLLIAERVETKIESDMHLLPAFEVPAGETEESWLRKESYRGAEQRYKGEIPPSVVERIEHELKVINRMGFPAYMLIVADLVRHAKETGIRVGPGRGCLSGDSLVMTPTGLVPIKNIEVDDLVFDETGTQVAVTNTFEYDCDEPLIEIQAFYGGQGNKMTADHEVLISRQVSETNRSRLAQGYRFSKEVAEPEWIRADQVQVGDLVVTPKLDFVDTLAPFEIDEPTYVSIPPIKSPFSSYSIAPEVGFSIPVVRQVLRGLTSSRAGSHQAVSAYLARHGHTPASARAALRTTSTCNATIKADHDTGMLLGLFISDGWVRSNDRNTVGFAANRSEDAGLIPDLIRRVFGVEAVWNDHKKTNLRQYSINHRGITHWFRSLFPEYEYTAQSKYIPSNLMSSSEEFRRGLLAGLWEGDGTTKDHTKYTTVSKRLAHDVMLLLGSLGLAAGIKIAVRTDSRPEYYSEGRTDYSILTSSHFGEIKRQCGVSYDGKYTYYRVRSIKETPSEGKVYDFTVPTTHSYVTDSYVVHNSATGCMLAYVLGITELDPIEHGLIFERFLNEERISMPDIDLDFDERRRGEMIQYAVDKYGEERVSQIVTYGTIKGKQALKDSGRSLGYPYSVGENLTKALPPMVLGKDMALADCFDPKAKRYGEAKDMREAYKDPDNKKVIDTALGLEGLKRQVGVHAAGVIISKDPLLDTIPIWKRPADGAIITQFDMGTCEKIGLLKMDFLGLRNLTVIDDTLKQIKRNHGIDLVLEDLTLDDPKAFELLKKAETIGIFQLEGGPMRSLLRQLGPTAFEDIAAVLALYRPGPMGVGAHTEFAERKNGRRPIVPIHPELEVPLADILGETYGLCVAGDTLVWDAVSGRRVRIDSIEHQVKAGQFKTFGVDEAGHVVTRNVTHWIPTGKKKVLEVRTNSGGLLRLSEDHPVLTPSGWKKAGELRAGSDRLATPTEVQEAEKQGGLTIEEARFLGYMTGDGYITGRSNHFVNVDRGLRDHVIELAAGLFPDCHPALNLVDENGDTPAKVEGLKRATPRVSFMLNPQGVGRGRGLRNARGSAYSDLSMNHWFEKLGFMGATLSADKFIPEVVFESPSLVMRHYLAGLWDTDGCVTPKFTFLKTISRRLAEDTSALLGRLGIQARVKIMEEYESGRRGATQAYGVYVYDSAFWEQVVPLMKHGDKNGVRRWEMTTRPSRNRGINGNLMLETMLPHLLADETLPHWIRKGMNTRGAVSEGAVRSYLIRHHGAAISKADNSGVRAASYVPMNAFAESYLEHYGTDEDMLYANQNWTTITEITEVPAEEMYDITVQDVHNFLGNGYILHNCIYQEQVAAVAVKVADYTLGQADMLRRAMGKKKKEILDKEYIPFHNGMIANDYSEDAVKALWDTLVPFADYAFNKSHTAGYGLVSYWTAYLKANYPAEYMASLLTSVGDDKNKTALYLTECKKMGIRVTSPDINESDHNFTANTDGDIRFGLAAIRNVGDAVIESIVRARVDGPFTGLEEFLRRVDGCNKKTLDSLVKAGAFDGLGLARLGLTMVSDEAVQRVSKTKKAESGGQFDLFSAFGIQAIPDIVVPVDEWEKPVKLAFEREMLGLYVSGHPLDGVDLSHESATGIIDLGEMYDGSEVKIAGIVSSVQMKVSRAGKPWAIAVIEDLTGSVEVLFFSKAYTDAVSSLVPDAVLVVAGRIESRDGEPKITAMGSRTPGANTQVKQPSVNDYTRMIISLTTDDLGGGLVGAITAALKANPGELEVSVETPSGRSFPVPIKTNGLYPLRAQLQKIEGVGEINFA